MNLGTRLRSFMMRIFPDYDHLTAFSPKEPPWEKPLYDFAKTYKLSLIRYPAPSIDIDRFPPSILYVNDQNLDHIHFFYTIARVYNSNTNIVLCSLRQAEEFKELLSPHGEIIVGRNEHYREIE